VPRHMLLFLPIHKRPREKYYAEQAVHEAKARAGVETAWGKPFDSLSREVQLETQEDAFWPPWFYNDLLGFMEIGSDGGSYLVGAVYLKRKYFRREAHQRRFGRYPEIVYYEEITKRPIQVGDNDSYVEVALKLVKEARTSLRQRFRTSDVWLPTYDLKCINLAEADRQLRANPRTAFTP
jgi:hypothetical protein